MSQQRLFAFTRTSAMLVGQEVRREKHIRQAIRTLQKQKRVVEDWRLDIFCRSPDIITGVTIGRTDMSSAAATYGRYCIQLVLSPQTLEHYTVAVGYLQNQEEVEMVLEVMREYIGYRYGVREMINRKYLLVLDTKMDTR